VNESAGRAFLVCDETGVARVDLSGADAAVTIDYERSSGTWNNATPELEEFLAARGKSSKGGVFDKTLRYREGVIEEGETVTVVGHARWEVDASLDVASAAGAGYREAPKRLVLSSNASSRLLVTDAPDMTEAS
jgi:hypothetical protein